MIHMYNGILFSNKKWNLAICDSIAGPCGYYANWISQTDKEKYCMTSLRCGIWKNKRINEMKQKQTHRYREWVDGWLRGGGGRMRLK